MDARKTRKRLALAISAALLVPGMAFAGDAKEKELEARIAQLEAQVQALLAAQQQQQATITQTQTQLDEVRVAQAAPADGKPKIQSSPILVAGNPDGRFSFGGFIKLDAMYTDTSDGEIADGSAGRMFYLPSAIPVGGSDESGGDIDTHAQFSRFWFTADGEVQGHKTRAYLEFDLFGGGMANLGNQASTNTHGVTLRQAYVSWDKWLAGQTWSNFMDVAALPDAVDFVGVTDGTVFVRQAQLRYSKGRGRSRWRTRRPPCRTAARVSTAGTTPFPMPPLAGIRRATGATFRWPRCCASTRCRPITPKAHRSACPANSTSARTTTFATRSTQVKASAAIWRSGWGRMSRSMPRATCIRSLAPSASSPGATRAARNCAAT